MRISKIRRNPKKKHFRTTLIEENKIDYDRGSNSLCWFFTIHNSVCKFELIIDIKRCSQTVLCSKQNWIISFFLRSNDNMYCYAVLFKCFLVIRLGNGKKGVFDAAILLLKRRVDWNFRRDIVTVEKLALNLIKNRKVKFFKKKGLFTWNEFKTPRKYSPASIGFYLFIVCFIIVFLISGVLNEGERKKRVIWSAAVMRVA